MPTKCVCRNTFPALQKGCTSDGLPKKRRVGKKPGPKVGSHNATSKKRKYVTSVVITPSKRVKHVTPVSSVLGKRRAESSMITRLKKRMTFG